MTMTHRAGVALAVLMLTACSRPAATTADNATAPVAGKPVSGPAPSAAGNDTSPAVTGNDTAGDAGKSGLGPVEEKVSQVDNCVLETPKGMWDGTCERVEWDGGPSFLMRRKGGKPMVDGITEVVVEVDRPGEKAGGSYRRGANGDLVPTGPLTFRDDCACWVRHDFRVGAYQWQ